MFCLDGQADRSLGTMGYVRMNFDSSGRGFCHTWWPHDGRQFNTPEFKETLQQFVSAIRTDGPLRGLPSMDRLCRQNGGVIMGDGLGYGYLAEVSGYRFCFRYTTSPGEYQCYLYCYDLHQQTLDRPMGRMSFANGEHMELAAPQDYLRTIREEPPTKGGTGFLFETLTDTPAVRKAMDDMVYDPYGEGSPRPLEDYASRQGPEIEGQQM